MNEIKRENGEVKQPIKGWWEITHCTSDPNDWRQISMDVFITARVIDLSRTINSSNTIALIVFFYTRGVTLIFIGGWGGTSAIQFPSG